MSAADLDAWNRLGERGAILQKAFHAARNVLGEVERPTLVDYPASVRVLAGAALFRGGLMPAKAAARDCGVGDQARLSPSRVSQAGATDERIAAVIAYLKGGAEPACMAVPAQEQGNPVRLARAHEAKRLYIDEGLSLIEAGKRMTPNLSPGGVWGLLKYIGVETRPLGTQAKRPEGAAPTKLRKPHRSTVSRFASREIDPDRAMDLKAEHPALSEGRSIFSASVVGARQAMRLLVSGHNNPKLGREVLKGPRSGWPIFQLTLEERATCPRSCPVWAGCYGNAMPFARRHRADDELMQVLRLEVAATAKLYPGGFLVRLHTLGDFFSVPYVLLWGELLAAHPQLHIFGYTARREDDEDPESRKIASAIGLLTKHLWSRFAIRTSHADFGPQRSVVVGAVPSEPDVLLCPAQVHATEACATCGLCWAEAARDKTIAFLKHGMKRAAGPRGKRAPVTVTDEPALAAAAASVGIPDAPAKLTRPPLAELPTMPRERLVRATPRGARLETRVEASSVTRMKAVNDRVVGWARAYLAKGGVTVEYLADLFNVDADALSRAIGPEARAA